ncbi:MAG: hypothetical protein RLZZ19_712 [Actinomycetota bacterium]
MARILCIGDAALDVIVQINDEIHYGSDSASTISMHGGGAAANTATWLSELGHSVYFSCRIGAVPWRPARVRDRRDGA